MTETKRFLAKVEFDFTSACWNWTGAIQSKGYGSFGRKLSHRWAYERFVGPIPDGMQLDHTCRNTRCVNPAHLEPVSNLENQRRRQALQTHCKQGHPLSGDNLRMKGNRRVCVTCARASSRKSMQKRRAA